MLKYSCANCKHKVKAEKDWAGFSCVKILHINDARLNLGKGDPPYLCGDDPVLIVQDTFLCSLYEPKE